MITRYYKQPLPWHHRGPNGGALSPGVSHRFPQVFDEAFVPPLPCAKPSSEAASFVALRRANVTDAVHAAQITKERRMVGMSHECDHSKFLVMPMDAPKLMFVQPYC